MIYLSYNSRSFLQRCFNFIKFWQLLVQFYNFFCCFQGLYSVFQLWLVFFNIICCLDYRCLYLFLNLLNYYYYRVIFQYLNLKIIRTVKRQGKRSRSYLNLRLERRLFIYVIVVMLCLLIKKILYNIKWCVCINQEILVL